MRTGTITVDSGAVHLSEEMAARDDIMREIIEETLPDDDSAKVHESGRTICGDGAKVKGPLARFPTSVELAQCPRGVNGGTWHTHVTQKELRNPTNSIPDTANVIFGDIDVSAVVGTQTMEMVAAPSDREAAINEFQNILGVEATTTDEVVEAIIGGEIKSPKDVRSRLRSEMAPLFITRRTGFSDLDSQINQSSIPASSPLTFEMQEAHHYATMTARRHTKNPVRDPGGMRAMIQHRNDRIKDSKIGKLTGEVALSKAIGNAIERLFF